jgi:hypothetical protein
MHGYNKKEMKNVASRQNILSIPLQMKTSEQVGAKRSALLTDVAVVLHNNHQLRQASEIK